MQSLARLRAIVVYSGMFGTTEAAAELVADALSARLERPVPCHDVSWFDLAGLADYDLVVLGAATWNIGQLPYGWADKLPDLSKVDLAGKTAALFGLGDQLGYPETFLDALGMVADSARRAGARLVGSWPTTGYEFSGSLALEHDRFVGLALDDDNQEELTAQRIRLWVDGVLNQMAGAHPSATSAPLATAAG